MATASLPRASGATLHRRPLDADPNATGVDWRRSLANAIRTPDELLTRLGLPDELREPARRAAEGFPVVVPESYLLRMRPGDPRDPLLLQVLPLGAELAAGGDLPVDAVGDIASARAPGLLHKYEGRALLIAARECAVHCRYCFRRHFPYGESPASDDDWTPALETIAADPSINEIILSGGDPLVLSDRRLRRLADRVAAIPHLRRLRIHSRLPVVLPERVTPTLLEILRASRLTPIFVIHANHANEIAGDCAEALRTLVRAGVTTLNQAVLLRDVNDSVDAQVELNFRLVDLGVMPYYLHQLDRVAGVTHFEVPPGDGEKLVEAMRKRLPGYAVPRYVREIPGASSKLPVARGSADFDAG